MDNTKESIGVKPIPTVVVVGVGDEIVLGWTPECLQEAQNLRCLGLASWALKSKESGEFVSFDECPMLSCNCKEGRSLNLLPKVEARVIPMQRVSMKVSKR